MTTETTPKKPRGPRGNRPRVAPETAAKPTLPATDAGNTDVPLLLSPDAVQGTRDRALAMDWTDEGHAVRKRADGVYEQVMESSAPAVPVAENYEFYPDVEMLDRRLLDPNINTSVPIYFKDETAIKPGQPPKYYKRWVDTHIPSRALTLTQRGGYKKAEWSMLADISDVSDRHETTDAFVRRGEKGRYLLLFMPYRKWTEIKTAQAHQRMDRERQFNKSLHAEAASRELGARAGDVMSRTDEAGRSAVFGSIKEMAPMSMQRLESSGLPKDVAGGGIQLEQ
jgi:hypothetical protein